MNFKIGDKEIKEGIYIAFSPEKINEISDSNINVWLINNTSYQVLFTYSLFHNKKLITLEIGSAKAFESLLIKIIENKKLNDFFNFKIDALFFDEQEHEHHAPLSEIIKLKPIKLYKENAFSLTNFIPEKALVISVSKSSDFETETTSPVSKAELSKISFQKKTNPLAQITSKLNAGNSSEEIEINLHIEELLENFKGMSNAEIIQVQLKYFQEALDKAIIERYKKLIVIHGIGNGRLKQEVRNLVSSDYDLQFYDASYSKYGFGATEIMIG